MVSEQSVEVGTPWCNVAAFRQSFVPVTYETTHKTKRELETTTRKKIGFILETKSVCLTFQCRFVFNNLFEFFRVFFFQ